jgi:hypothetical protein
VCRINSRKYTKPIKLKLVAAMNKSTAVPTNLLNWVQMPSYELLARTDGYGSRTGADSKIMELSESPEALGLSRVAICYSLIKL